ncbi:MAG TPA: LysR substrate-binding domain-containing protein [Steroidobacteraceae bacterium]|nr:LysR substrate-binding domain-containing protein [Steroidobacteraceae bacterium]
MTLRELRYLVALAEREHFGRAAEDCHISQPTLSTQIRKLEEYLGATLIERNAKSFTLTPVGRTVVQQARQILSQVDELVATTRVPRGPLAGLLNLGIIPTLAPYFLPSFIPLTKKHYPRLQLVVHEDLTGHLLEQLRNYQIDAALLALPLQDEDLEQQPLFDEPFWFACPQGHRLAGAAAVSEADLGGEPLLLLSDGHCLRGQALAACGRQPEAEEGLDDFRAVSLETICQLVTAGFGCTLLPALATHPLMGHLPFAILPIRSVNASRRIGLVWRRGYPKASDLSLLGRLVRENRPEGTRPVSSMGSPAQRLP